MFLVVVIVVQIEGSRIYPKGSPKSRRCHALQAHVHTNPRVDALDLPQSIVNMPTWTHVRLKYIP